MNNWSPVVSRKRNAVVVSLLFAVLTAGTVTAAIPTESLKQVCPLPVAVTGVQLASVME